MQSLCPLCRPKALLPVQVKPSWPTVMVVKGFKGTLDNVRVYNRALTTAEMRQLADDEPFARFWRLLSISGARIRSRSCANIT